MSTSIKHQLPILFSKEIFLFPKIENYLPLNEKNKHWKEIILMSLKNFQGKLIVVPFCQENDTLNETIGVLSKINLEVTSEEIDLNSIISSLKQVQLQGIERIKIISASNYEESKVKIGTYQLIQEEELDEPSKNSLAEKFLRRFTEILEKTELSSIENAPKMTMITGNVSNMIDYIAQNGLKIDQQIRWQILATPKLEDRLKIIINLIDNRKVEEEINKATEEEIKEKNREYWLRKQRDIINKRLGETNFSDKIMEDYLEKLENNPYPDYVKQIIKEKILHYRECSNVAEANNIKIYIKEVMSLPWFEKTKQTNDLSYAIQKLNENHYGLSKVKERIIGFLAEQQKANKALGQVICLVGPPGTGKTSLATSIAEATGRKFVNISVGGIRDVAEIQGHRSTYIGAMPGRIIQAMKKAQVINPCFLIDEIDKISSDHRGDPAYALLEILDPNQNKRFIDSYLGEEMPYNLSEVMFICTANDERELPLPLLDRMEVIHLSSYTEVEKLRIAKEHLISENLKRYNLKAEEISFSDEAIKEIIKHYTREAGVRELNRKIREIIRKFLVESIQKNKEKLEVTPENLKYYLDKKNFDFTQKQKQEKAGIATGLAWTGYGGDILPIEVIYYPRKEGELELTGNLGDIMKESGKVALNYIKSNYKEFGISYELFSQNSIHVHVPEGATPKEGPSAGIALTSAIISALTRKIIPADIGMTGEITLHGYVEKIGGLKEKSIAAHRSKLKTIIIPKKNEEDIKDIPEEIRQELKIILVEKYEEVWKIIFSEKEKTTLSKRISTKNSKRRESTFIKDKLISTSESMN